MRVAINEAKVSWRGCSNLIVAAGRLRRALTGFEHHVLYLGHPEHLFPPRVMKGERAHAERDWAHPRGENAEEDG